MADAHLDDLNATRATASHLLGELSGHTSVEPRTTVP